MRIKLTLVRTAADPVDLAATVDGTATVAELARALAERDPLGGPDAAADALTVRVHGRDAAATRLLAPEAAAAETVRSGAVVSLARPNGADGPVRAAGVARLEVLDGPDAGLVVALPEGTTILGRGRGCDVRLSDPTVSTEHARLAVTDLVEIVDLRSANGLLLGNGLVSRATLLPEDTVALGDTTIRVFRTAANRHAAADAAHGAHVAFNRSPRLAPVYEGSEVEAPTPPELPKPGRFPMVMLLVPLLLAPLLLLLGRDALSLVFLAGMPLLAVGTFLDQRGSSRRTYRAAVAQFTVTMSDVRAERAAERERERAARLAESPAVEEVTAAALALEPLLWSRRAEHGSFLDLRLGLGTLPSRSPVTLPRRSHAPPDCWDQVVSLQEDFAGVDDVPATVRLRESGALGLAGPRPVVDGVARAVVAQLVGLHSPAELVLTVATSAASAARWDWTKWLPHVGSAHSPLDGAHLGSDQAGARRLVSRIEGLLDARGAQRTQGGGASGALPAVVLLVEDDAPVERGRLVRIAEEGPDVGVHVLWCASALERLPAACRTFVSVTTSATEGVVGHVRTGRAVAPLRCETLAPATALQLARHLAAVVDAGAPADDASDLPTRVSYLSLVGTEIAQGPWAVLERWRENGSLVPRDGAPPRRRRSDATLRAVIGRGASEPFTLDLRSQGPHALVGGTTGAGKSELLQAWVLGMATAHSPDRVTFLLVDYKGGSAFADCVALPHTVGLVTDLSPHLVRRALTSLRAELRHRERLLARQGAKDLLTLERTGDPDCPPSLVLVVDEFATLVNEVPQFVDGVVDVAARGRSLGLHLILATQRPAGVIRDTLRANTNLRVALRMNDESDSGDVLGLPIAAGFDPAVPGRAAARTGPGRVTLFQTGYAGGRTPPARPTPTIEVETLTMGTGTRWEPPEDPERHAREPEEGATDLARVVASVRAAARAGRVPEPRKPWLPPLPPVADLADLSPRTDTALALGVADDPADQRQIPAYFRPDLEGNIAFYGAGGSGKSTALRTLATGAGITPDGGPVHVYGLDFSSGGLSPLAGLPHVGAVLDGEDAERVSRLLRLLRDTVEERSVRYAAARASTVEEYRRIAGRPDEPRILLLLDGFGAFRHAWETSPGRMAWYQLFLRLLVDGRGAGVHVAVTADRPGAIPSSVTGSIPRKVVLRQVDEGSYSMLGAPKDVLDAGSPPGRAISPDGLEMQVAVLGGSATLAEQVRAVETLGASLRRAGVRPAPGVRRLPELVPAEEMPVSVGGLPVLGIADDTLEPVGFAPAGTFLLAGPPRSGRTNALRWLVASIARARPDARFVYLGARRSVLRHLDLWDRAATGPAEAAEVARAALADVAEPPEEGATGTVVVLEALADFLSGAAEAPLTELLRMAKRNEHFVLAEGDTSTWGSSWPLISEIRSGRRGLALQPDQVEGDALFRTAFPRVARTEFAVGRGMVVDRATVRRVQLPLVP